MSEKKDAAITPSLTAGRGEPVVAAACEPTVRIRLLPSSKLESFVDGQTHLVVTRDAEVMPERLVGYECRVRRDVRIEPVAAPAKERSDA